MKLTPSDRKISYPTYQDARAWAATVNGAARRDRSAIKAVAHMSEDERGRRYSVQLYRGNCFLGWA